MIATEALSQLNIPTRTIPYNNQDIQVRALCLDDITALMRTHSLDLNRLVDQYTQGNDATEHKDPSKILSSTITKLPSLTASVIAISTDSPNHAHVASKLPLPIQLELLLAVYALTVEEAGGIKKFVESLLQMTQNLNLSLNHLVTPNGSIN